MLVTTYLLVRAVVAAASLWHRPQAEACWATAQQAAELQRGKDLRVIHPCGERTAVLLPIRACLVMCRLFVVMHLKIFGIRRHDVNIGTDDAKRPFMSNRVYQI